MFGLGVIFVMVAVIFGGFYLWARRHGLVASEQAAGPQQKERHISLLTEAVAYVGAILLLAGAVTAIGQNWAGLTDLWRSGIFAGGAAFFLIVGLLLYRMPEPAIQRLVGVAWFLSAACVAGAAGFATLDSHGNPGSYTVLAIGLSVTAYSAVLWLVRRRALQSAALFAGLIVTVCGTIVTIAEPGPAPSLAFALALWGLGLAWAALGHQRYVEPLWVTMPSGVLLALIAPSFGVGEHGWIYILAIASAAAAMAVSIPLRNTPLLALGSVAMFGYVTSAVIQYFGESLGVPASLAITGALIIGLAVVTARLMRATRESGPERTPHPIGPSEREEHTVQEPSQRDLRKAS